MCGRFTPTTKLGAVAVRFGVARFLEEVRPRYNIAPAQTMIVVNDDDTRHLTQMRWGLIPPWAKDSAIGNRMINARAETVATAGLLSKMNRRRAEAHSARSTRPRGRC